MVEWETKSKGKGQKSVEVRLNRKPPPEQLLPRRFTWPTLTRGGQDNFLVSVQVLASDKERFRANAYCFSLLLLRLLFLRRLRAPNLLRSVRLVDFFALLSIVSWIENYDLILFKKKKNNLLMS